jgi:hypothetical protein
MIINTPAIDYLTLTSYNRWDYESFQRAILASEQGRMIQGRLMQYSGIKGASMFVGGATVQGRDHFIFSASGERAQTAALVLAEEMPGSCTRVDIQITVPMPFDYDCRWLADGLRWSDWIGYKRPVNIRDNEDGFDTVYVGLRNSGDFTRIYIKTDGENMWLRFETQFQKRRAVRVWPAIANDRAMMDRVLRGRVDAIPELDEPGMNAIRQAVSVEGLNVAAQRRVPGENSTYIWLRDTVSPVVERMINDHDWGEQVTRLVRGWAESI